MKGNNNFWEHYNKPVSYTHLDVYKRQVYKIASFIPLEWEAEKPVKVLWVSMDVSQEKKAEDVYKRQR